MKQLLRQANRLLIGGHRGCACQYPENSIAAMQEGLRRGADYLEIDVQLTKDQIPVVIHDVRLEKQTSLQGYVHEHICEELRLAIPGMCTLREAMEWGRQANAYFGLEIKSVPLDMQPTTLRLVEQIGVILAQTQMTENVFVFSADYQTLRHLKANFPQTPIGLIVPYVPENPVQLMKDMDAIIYLSYIYNMTPSIVRDLQKHGYYVSGAILREEKWVQRAFELNVNMFESDHPEWYRD